VTDIDPLELLLADLDAHLEWLERVADSRGLGDLPVLATAMDASREQLQRRAKAVRDHLALGDTGVLDLGDIAGPDDSTTQLSAPPTRRRRLLRGE